MSIDQAAVRELYNVATCILDMLKEGEKIDYKWIEDLGDALFTIDEQTGWRNEIEVAMERAIERARRV